MERVRSDVARLSHLEGLRRPTIIAVAMLTALGDRNSTPEPSGDGFGQRRIIQLAKLAAETGLDGVLTSPNEAAQIRAACGRRFTIVSSGLGRSARDGENGESVAQAAEMLRAGADYLVVGSLIWRAEQPLKAARDLVEQMEGVMRTGPRLAVERYPSRQL